MIVELHNTCIVGMALGKPVAWIFMVLFVSFAAGGWALFGFLAVTVLRGAVSVTRDG